MARKLGFSEKNGGDSFRKLAQYLGLGTQLAAAVAGFGLIGYWLDSTFHTGQRYTTILLFLGAIGGMYNFIKTVIDLGKKENGGKRK